MTSTTTAPEAVAAKPVPPLLYPTLLLAGIAVIVVSMLGIAAMTGLLPHAQSQAVSTQASLPASGKQRINGKAAAPGAHSAPAKSAVNKPALPAAVAATSARCAECGVVDTIRTVESGGQGSGIGAVAGGVVGGILGNQVGGGRGRTAMTVVGAGAGAYAGHEVEKNMNRSVSYEVRVRMDDNTYRTFRTPQPDVGVGQRVQVRDGRLVRAG